MYYLLRKAAMTPEEIAEEIDADLETVKRTARRGKDTFVFLENGRLGLVRKEAA